MSLDAQDWGWNLVGYSVNTDVPPKWLLEDLGGLETLDSVALFQEESTLDCALVFEGTDRTDESDWVADANMNPGYFCNIPNVHEGFRAKLMMAVSDPEYRE